MTRAAAIEFCAAVALFAAAIVFGLGLLIAMFKMQIFCGVNVLFYRGLVLILVVTVIIFALSLWITLRANIAPSAALSAAALSASVNLAVLIVLPVTIDRSISMFLLGYMDQHAGEVFTPDELRGAFQNVYLGRWNQIQRRMGEQRLSGNVEIAQGGYRITPQGRSFVAFSRKVAWAFDTDTRFVSPGAKRENSNKLAVASRAN
jgi:hypothetical protein